MTASEESVPARTSNGTGGDKRKQSTGAEGVEELLTVVNKPMLVRKKTDEELAEVRQQMQQEIKYYRHLLKKMERCTIHPNGRFVQRWDLVTITCLLFTAFVTPYEVGFLQSGMGPGLLPLWCINRAVDSV